LEEKKVVFPIVGTFSGHFSNRWKKFRAVFQSLETPPVAGDT
jgi:hypothetical protein